MMADKIQEIQLNLKQELKVESEKFRKQKVLQQRRYVNRMLKINLKKVYREMRGNDSKPVKDMPEKEATEEFWKSMWENPKEHRSDTPWMEMLKREYCKEATQKKL